MDPYSNSLRSDLKKDGYSREEEYFYKLNRDLIRRRRQEQGRPSRREHEETESEGEERPQGLWRRIRAFFGKADTGWRP